jgi:hypothetical protein
MTVENFKSIITQENLTEPILNQKPINMINAYGYYYESGSYIAFRTDEKAYMFITKEFNSEEKVLDELLEWLRNKKNLDNL